MVPDPSVDPTAFLMALAKSFLAAVVSGNVPLVLSLALLACVAVLRFFFADKIPFLKTDLGATSLTLAMGILGALVTALAGGGAFSLALLLMAFKVAFGAMGGFAFFMKFLKPLLAKLGIKLPEAKGVTVPVNLESTVGGKPLPEPEGIPGIVGPISER